MHRIAAPASVALAVVLLAAPANAAGGADVHIGSVEVPHVDSAPPIDGSLESPAWKTAAAAPLMFSLRNHHGAAEATTVYLLSDGTFLYVGIDAKQSIPVRATEHTNGVGLDTDDEVQVDLWPNGTSGFRYKFTSTAIGTHYQYSTENNSFEPEWWSAGKIVPGGYFITMKIPLAVMHGTGSGDWRVQFIRYMPVTNDVFVWSYSPVQQDFNDVNYSGSLAGLPRLSAQREKARVGVYGLGAIASRSIGGSTTRAGADLSIPLISGTSFVGTIHPDYSNVEVDQQTIAPTAFTRIFQEVRPFFTQGANFYSYPNGICAGCPGTIEFYTPKIPTPRDGFAVEGQRGLFSYGTLHTISVARNDTAEAINYVSRDQTTALNFQGSDVRCTADATTCNATGVSVRDMANGMTFTHDDLKGFQQFARYATDSGTFVLNGAQGQRYEGGFGLYRADGTHFQAVVRKIGAFFNPLDGLVQHPDIAGYDVNFFKPFKYATTAKFTEFDVNGDLARYHDQTGALDQVNSGMFVSLTTRTLFNLQGSTGASAVSFFPGAAMIPVNQNGIQLGYNLNSALPTFASFNTGRFGPGRLNSWTRSTTFRTGSRGSATLEFDDTDQRLDTGDGMKLWLERFNYAYQSGPNESLAFGIRRIIGSPPQLFAPQLPLECLGATAITCSNAWNLSAAFHRKMPGGELYLVYGDASLISTSPQFIIKYIKYFGADKGT